MDAILEKLILQTLLDGPAHGYGIAERIQKAGAALLEADEGAIYPTLYRLQQAGWIAATRGDPREGSVPKTYALTERGRAWARKVHP